MPSSIDALLQFLRGHPLMKDVRVIDFDETSTGNLEVKLRCRLVGGYHMQIWLHEEPNILDYAFQFFLNQPLLRWDNAPHYPNISTFPHHFHNEYGNVTASTLTGKPMDDLETVLSEIEKWLKKAAK